MVCYTPRNVQFFRQEKPIRNTHSLPPDTLNKIATPRTAAFENVCEQLLRFANELGPGEKMPTVAQLCDLTRVSVKTVDRALGVLEARSVIVRRKGVGIYVAPHVGKRVISLVCDAANFRSSSITQFWDILLGEAQVRAGLHNEILEMHFYSVVDGVLSLPIGLMSDIRSGRISGVLLVGSSAENREWLVDAGMPTVTFAGKGTHMVGIAMEDFYRIGAEALAKKGCRRIACWFPVPFWTTQKTFDETFRVGLQAAGVPYLPEIQPENNGAINANSGEKPVVMQQIGYERALATFSGARDSWPDGIVIGDDTMTLGALSAMEELGIRVGHNVQIATHANRSSSLLIGWQDRMVVIEVDPGEIVSKMFQQLERLMDGQTDVETNLDVVPRERIADYPTAVTRLR